MALYKYAYDYDYDMKPHPSFQMISFSMTLSDP